MENLSFWLIWAALGAAMLIYYLRCYRTFRSMLWGVSGGLVLLVLMHYCGGFIGFVPELNLFNIMQAGVLGVPGVVLMAVVNIIL